MSNSKLTLQFTAGFVNHKTLDLDICVNDRLIFSNHDITDENFSIDLCVGFPCHIDIQTSGKNMHTDTVIDQQGNIVQDKFVKIDSMILDRMPVPKHIIENSLVKFSSQSGQQLITNYLGFNGSARIDLDFPDNLTCILSLLSVDQK